MGRVPTWKLFEAIVYDLNVYESNPELFNRFSRILGFYCSPLHDKDVYDEVVYNEDGSIKHNVGDLKVPHFHLICHNANGLSLKGCEYELKSYVTSQNVFVIPIKVLVSAVDYLNHKGFDDKFQYADDFKKFGDTSAIDQRVRCGKDKNKQFIYDLNLLSEFELACRYGKDFIKNRKSYMEFAKDVFVEDYEIKDEELYQQRRRYYRWLKIYRPSYEYANFDDFVRFEKINGVFDCDL